MIRLRLEHKAYADQPLFENFELSLKAGELLCLLGPSGCGKSTLLNTIAGLDQQFDGELEWLTGAPSPCHQPHDLNSISYMFQQPRLLPWRTVRQNLQLVIDADRHHRVDPLLAQMGLSDCAESYPNCLSLGMARRVALARCLIIDPEIILMDEPFVSLDPITAAEMRILVQQLRQRRPNTSILFVTHDVREAVELADRILVLGDSPTRVVHQWQADGQERGADFLIKQERDLLSYFQPTA